MGQLMAAGVLQGLVSRPDEWSYHIPLPFNGSGGPHLFPVLLFATESPSHLPRKGRLEEAEKSLKRLQSCKANIDTNNTLAIIVQTNNLEQKLEVGTFYKR
jgi:MFS transporter, SP family, general alpha glucoside:H+ symporter